MIQVTIANGSDVGAEDDVFFINPRWVVAIGPSGTAGVYRIVVQGQSDKDDILIKSPTDEKFARQVRNFAPITKTERDRDREQAASAVTPVDSRQRS